MALQHERQSSKCPVLFLFKVVFLLRDHFFLLLPSPAVPSTGKLCSSIFFLNKLKNIKTILSLWVLKKRLSQIWPTIISEPLLQPNKANLSYMLLVCTAWNMLSSVADFSSFKTQFIDFNFLLNSFVLLQSVCQLPPLLPACLAYPYVTAFSDVVMQLYVFMYSSCQKELIDEKHVLFITKSACS